MDVHPLHSEFLVRWSSLRELRPGAANSERNGGGQLPDELKE